MTTSPDQQRAWWETWRAALIAVMPAHPSGPLESDADADGAEQGHIDARNQLYAMQCATLIADRAHGFRAVSYKGP